jgi:hypothetical protein
MPTKCRVCDNESGNKVYIVPEMMYGTGETFIYFQCSQCMCLQIADIPSDMTAYYPRDYYTTAFRQRRTMTITEMYCANAGKSYGTTTQSSLRNLSV